MREPEQSPSRKGKRHWEGRRAGGENPTTEPLSLHVLELSKAPHHTRNRVLTKASEAQQAPAPPHCMLHSS